MSIETSKLKCVDPERQHDPLRLRPDYTTESGSHDRNEATTCSADRLGALQGTRSPETPQDQAPPAPQSAGGRGELCGLATQASLLQLNPSPPPSQFSRLKACLTPTPRPPRFGGVFSVLPKANCSSNKACLCLFQVSPVSSNFGQQI